MQKGYEWLWNEPGPKMLREMLKLFGTDEVPGAKDNATIMKWAKEVEEPAYKNDAIPWCGLGVSVAAKRAGWEFKPLGNALWARNWAKWGKAAKVPMLGDVLVFGRGTGGHVALYVGEDSTHFHILGANQSDTVNIVRKAKTQLIEARRAPWKVAQPFNVRRVMLSSKGAPVAGKES